MIKNMLLYDNITRTSYFLLSSRYQMDITIILRCGGNIKVYIKEEKEKTIRDRILLNYYLADYQKYPQTIINT